METFGEQKVVIDDYTELTGTIIGAAMEVHDYWGPGLIANFLPNAQADAHLRSLLDHESPLVRVRATGGLAMIEAGGEVLLDQLKDSSRSVRIAASRGLASRNEAVTDPVAAKEWAEYLNFNSDRPQSLLMQANAAARESRPTDVLDYVQRATKLDSLNPEMYHQAAILLSSAGLNKEARKQLFTGWELAPKDPRFPYSLGLLAAESGDLESAVGYLEETVAMQPDFYRAWYNLSLAYSRLNQAEAAERAMRQASSARRVDNNGGTRSARPRMPGDKAPL